MRPFFIFTGLILSLSASSYAVSSCSTLEECRTEFKNGTELSRAETIKRFSLFGKDGIPDLINAFEQKDFYIRRNAGDALAKIGKDAVPALIDALKNENSFISSEAAYALKEIGPDARGAAPSLVKFMEKSLTRADKANSPSDSFLEEQYANNASDFIATIGTDILPLLLNSLNTKNGRFQRLVAKTIAKMGRGTIPSLIPLLDSPGYYFREGSCMAIGYIGPEAKDAVPSLIRLLTDERIPTRIAAINALGKIGPAANEAVPALILLLNENNPKTQDSVIYALGDIGSAATKALPDLWKVFEYNRTAAVALAKIDPSTVNRTEPILIELLNANPSTSIDNNIYVILGNMGPAVIPILIKSLNTENRITQENIISAFHFMGSAAKDAIPAILKVLKETHQILEQNPSYTPHAGGNLEPVRRLNDTACLALWDIDRTVAETLDSSFNCHAPCAL